MPREFILAGLNLHKYGEKVKDLFVVSKDIVHFIRTAKSLEGFHVVGR